MSEPFLSEIRLMSFNFAPKGWAQCNGQLMPINQNQALFALLGTTFGGNGQTTFGLPDFRGRTPIHVGAGHINGERGGEQSHTLSMAELPQHGHSLRGSANPAISDTPDSTQVPASGAAIYGAPAPGLVAMDSSMTSNAGGSQAHANMQPYLALTYCIALQGIFPSPN